MLAKRKAFWERGSGCEVAGCRNRATDAHHVFFHRRKGDTYLDVEENLQLVCYTCHNDGTANSKKNVMEFFEVQRWRYGDEHMKKWLEDLPQKVRNRRF